MKELQDLKEISHNIYKAVYNNKEILLTKSSYPPYYGERKFDNLREWIPSRSKLSAVLLKGYNLKFRGDEKLLYLGAASGTTVSHISDILDKGIIYAVEYSAKPFSKFLELSKMRKNIIPIFADASKPENYSGIVEKVDFIYQDIAQKNQIDIFIKNSNFFLKENGEGIIMVKARSIDSTEDPEVVFNEVLKELRKRFKVLAFNTLEPFHSDHIFVHVKVLK